MDTQAKERLVRDLWQNMDRQDWQALSEHFIPGGEILWHDTNERFNVTDFVRANSEYPGNWRIDILRLDVSSAGGMVSVCRVSMAGGPSFHVCSFFSFDEAAEKIRRIDEYWGEVGPAPDWRRQLGIGTPIIAKNF